MLLTVFRQLFKQRNDKGWQAIRAVGKFNERRNGSPHCSTELAFTSASVILIWEVDTTHYGEPGPQVHKRRPTVCRSSCEQLNEGWNGNTQYTTKLNFISISAVSRRYM